MAHAEDREALLSREKVLTVMLGTLNKNNKSKLVSQPRPKTIKNILDHVRTLAKEKRFDYLDSLPPAHCIRVREYLERTKEDKEMLTLFIRVCQVFKIRRPLACVNIPYLTSSNSDIGAIMKSVRGFPYGVDGLVHLKLKRSYIPSLGRELFNCYDVDAHQEVHCTCAEMAKQYGVPTWGGHVAAPLEEALKRMIEVANEHEPGLQSKDLDDKKQLLQLVTCGTKMRVTPPRAECIRMIRKGFEDFEKANRINVPAHFGSKKLPKNASEEEIAAHKAEFAAYFAKWSETAANLLIEDLDEKASFPSSGYKRTIKALHRDFIICPTDKSPQTPPRP